MILIITIFPFYSIKINFSKNYVFKCNKNVKQSIIWAGRVDH